MIISLTAVLSCLAFLKTYFTLDISSNNVDTTKIQNSLLYFNLNKRVLGKAVLSHLLKSIYRKGSICIAILVTN